MPLMPPMPVYTQTGHLAFKACNLGFPKIDHSSSTARTVSEQSKISKKFPLMAYSDREWDRDQNGSLYIILNLHTATYVGT